MKNSDETHEALKELAAEHGYDLEGVTLKPKEVRRSATSLASEFAQESTLRTIAEITTWYALRCVDTNMSRGSELKKGWPVFMALLQLGHRHLRSEDLPLIWAYVDAQLFRNGCLADHTRHDHFHRFVRIFEAAFGHGFVDHTIAHAAKRANAVQVALSFGEFLENWPLDLSHKVKDVMVDAAPAWSEVLDVSPLSGTDGWLAPHAVKPYLSRLFPKGIWEDDPPPPASMINEWRGVWIKPRSISSEPTRITFRVYERKPGAKNRIHVEDLQVVHKEASRLNARAIDFLDARGQVLNRLEL